MDGTDADEVIRIRTNSLVADTPRVTGSSIWHGLRRRRIDAGLDVDELAARARLSVVTVEAIEAGAVDRLPIGAAGRSEVVRHCQALGTDPEPYLEAMRERRTPALARKFERQRPASRRSRLVIFGLVWAIVAIGFVATWLTTGGSEDTNTGPDPVGVGNEVPAGAPPADSPESTAPPSTVPEVSAPVPEAPAAGPEATAAPPAAVAVTLTAARDDVWVQVSVDGRRELAGLLRQGETGTWTGDEIDLVIGRPSAVELTVDGQPRPAEANMTLR